MSKPAKLDKLHKLDKEDLKKAFDLSHFDLNAVIRGVQLTLVGGMFYLYLFYLYFTRNSIVPIRSLIYLL